MPRPIHALRLCLMALATTSMSATLSAAPPVSAFNVHGQTDSVQISPAGKFVAVTSRFGTSERLTVLNYPDFSVWSQSDLGLYRDIDKLTWRNESRILIEPSIRFPGDLANHFRTGELVRFDVASKDDQLIYGEKANAFGMWPYKYSGYNDFNYWAGSVYAQATIADLLSELPNSILINTWGYDRKTNSSSLQRLDLVTGRTYRVAGSPVWDAAYLLDAKHQPLLVSGESEQGDFETWKYQGADKNWQRVSSNAPRLGFIQPIAVTDNPDEYIALDSTATSAASVVVWNPDTNERRVLFHKEAADVRVAGIDPHKRAWLFTYDDHYPEYWYPDPEHPLARAHRMVRETFKYANVAIDSSTDDMSVAVARVSAPRIPPAFYLVDVKNLKLLKMFAAHPALTLEDLSHTDPVELTVRDGVKIRGYLTTPKGVPDKNMPLLVKVHDGPHDTFDRYDFDPEVQLWASRGIAVLQVNYRGSAGRDRDFKFSGYGQWGEKMQNDITDAAKWALAAGIADPKRVCIYGQGYGGFAALTATFREPLLFRCAAGISGIYDLPLLFRSGNLQLRASGRRYLEDAVGTNKTELHRRSPIYNTNKTKAAIMLINGIGGDNVVPDRHAERLRERLTEWENPPVWVSAGDARADLSSVDGPATVHERMLAFFLAHLRPALPSAAEAR